MASKAIQPAVFVILARLLTPEDYGVMASATMVMSFSQIFWEAGMAKALIQYPGDRQAAANVAFWINIVLGLVVAGGLVAIADPVAERIFHDPRVGQVLRVMALQVFLAATVSVHVALLQKDLRFKHLFWVRLATIALPGMASIPLAWLGYGYWALVTGSIVGQVVQVLLYWITSPWRPGASFDRGVARRLGRFGGWVALSGLLAWFYGWADSLMVGTYLGTHELGLYRTGNAFVTMVYGFLFGPLMPVLYSHLSGIQGDVIRIRSSTFKAFKLLTCISIPLGFITFVLAEPISVVVFGGKWLGISSVIAILSLAQGFAWIIGADAEAFRAIGRADIETKAMIFTVPIYLFFYLVSVQDGFQSLLIARLIMVFVGIAVQFYFLKKFLNIKYSTVTKYALRITFVSVATLFVWVVSLSMFDCSITCRLLIAIFYIFLLILGIYMLERRGIALDLLNLIKRKGSIAA